MNDRFSKIVQATRARVEPEGKPESEESQGETREGARAYSVTSADRRQKAMVEFRFLGGNAKALAYSYLIGIDFDPSVGVVLDFSQYRVTLRGRNLRPVFENLAAHRVAFVRESDPLQAEATAAEGETVVTAIEVRDLDA
jgi:hypothetical protein